MKKLLLVVLTWMVLAGVSRAQDAPAGTKGAEPGMFTLAGQHVHRAKRWLAGRVLACFIKKGMNREQVRIIIGDHALPMICNLHRVGYYYPDLLITVNFQTYSDAAGATCDRMTDIFFVRY